MRRHTRNREREAGPILKNSSLSMQIAKGAAGGRTRTARGVASRAAAEHARRATSLGAVAIGLFFLCGGCASLPSQGPLASDVVRAGEAELATGVPRYLVANFDEHAASVVAREPSMTLSGTFGTTRPPATPVIGVGDVVAVTMWEAAGGGLFSSASVDGVSAGSHSAVIPEQTVGQDGGITVPFAGRIRVSGQTTAAAERMIVAALKGKAIQPQALVTVARNLSNVATVIGEVTAGARVPLSGRGDRVLDVIAAAGGVRVPVHETFIVLTRGNRSVRIPMQALMGRPQENVPIHAGDVLTVVKEPQTFTAFGATGRNALVPFDAIGITLDEAIAKAGGLIESQADAQGVFLMRQEPVWVAHELDPTWPIPPDAKAVNVIYNINLKDPATFFVARNFPVRHKDIMYVASAPASQLLKAMQVFSTSAGPAVTAAVLVP